MYEEKNAVFRPQTPSITVEIRSIRVKFRIRTLLIRITYIHKHSITMKFYAKNNADNQPVAVDDKKNVWNIIIQVLVAAITALAGVFTGNAMTL